MTGQEGFHIGDQFHGFPFDLICQGIKVIKIGGVRQGMFKD